MDWIAWKSRFSEIASKYKFAILILCVGILLMTLPDLQVKSEPETIPSEPIREIGLSVKLEEILHQIHGVGRVQVMLTESAGAETVYQVDEDRTVSEDTQSVRLETVLISAGSDDRGLVRTVTPPIYLGAIVVCQGGGDPAVRLAVVQAVSAVTGIGTDRISVLKMK